MPQTGYGVAPVGGLPPMRPVGSPQRSRSKAGLLVGLSAGAVLVLAVVVGVVVAAQGSLGNQSDGDLIKQEFSKMVSGWQFDGGYRNSKCSRCDTNKYDAEGNRAIHRPSFVGLLQRRRNRREQHQPTHFRDLPVCLGE
ncbi:hypothetical protein [Nocardia sp. NPDC050710]|uniref:hypothetical protein n=1 Tax=Nocardia sp. NPDC050710 TaxID=3157220 RepID=UPI0033FBB9D4